MIFPNDDNGHTLRRMEADGDDITQPRDVDFTVVFSNEETAGRFAQHFQELGYSTSTEFAETVNGFPWDVVVVKNMAPSHNEIGDFENLLQLVAAPLGGRTDGWGCFSVPRVDHS